VAGGQGVLDRSHSLKFTVPHTLVGFVIGKKGSNIKQAQAIPVSARVFFFCPAYNSAHTATTEIFSFTNLFISCGIGLCSWRN